MGLRKPLRSAAPASAEGASESVWQIRVCLFGNQDRVSFANTGAAKDRQDTRDFGDWSRKGPLPDLPGQQRRVSDRPPFAGRNLDNMSDAGSDRGGRRGYEPSDGKLRDFSNWERKGPLSPSSPAAMSLREGGRQQSKDGPGFRHNSPAWGEGRSQEGSRPPRREFQERAVPERAPTAAEKDNQWRSNMRPPEQPAKSPTPETSTPPSPAPAPVPATRPKLNLQKRTVSEADPTQSSAPATDSKSSPFGAARPVDTAAKEKEVEEKLQMAIRQRREADEKARAEKTEEKKLAKEKADLEKTNTKEAKESKAEKDPKDSKDEDTEAAPAAPKFDILRRVDSSTNDMVADEDEEVAEEAPAVDDKNVKPREIVQDTSKAKANGAWRNKKAPADNETAPTTAGALEEDGWSTVSKPTKQRNSRRNPQPTRAVAS